MKYVLPIIMTLLLMACSKRDDFYYRTHPLDLKEALNKCPNKAPNLVNCKRLHELSMHISNLADELRQNPQEFGQSILKLQNKIAETKKTLNHTHDAKLSSMLEQLEVQLSERKAIVKWLESPVG